MSTSHSGAAPARTSGLAPGMRVWFRAVPNSIRNEIEAEAIGIDEQGPGQIVLRGIAFTLIARRR